MTAIEKEIQEFQIPAMYLGEVEKMIAKMNRKAIKFGVNPAQYEVNHDPIDAVHYYTEFGGQPRKITYTAITVKVITDSTIVINGWELVARIAHEEFGNIINTVPGVEIDLSFYRDRGCFCDHCNTTRRRNDTYIIRNVSTGALKQIGRQCLADYIRTESAADMIAAFQGLKEIKIAPEFNMFKQVESFPVAELIAYAFKAIDMYGYKSRKAIEASGDYDKSTTASDMRHIRSEKLINGSKNPDYIPVEQLDMSEIPNIIDWLKNKFANPQNDFEHNMLMLASAENMGTRYFGHIAYAAQAYRKATQEAIASENKPKQASTYQGKIGDKIQVAVTLLRETPIETAYGTSYLWIMQDETGNKYSWFASNPPDIKEGETIAIKGTVKDHKEYKGEQQTQLTRCKVI